MTLEQPTILHIMLMFHYHAINEPYHRPSPAATEYTAQLLRAGLIYPVPDSPSGYRSTALGESYVRRLTEVKP